MKTSAKIAAGAAALTGAAALLIMQYGSNAPPPAPAPIRPLISSAPAPTASSTPAPSVVPTIVEAAPMMLSPLSPYEDPCECERVRKLALDAGCRPTYKFDGWKTPHPQIRVTGGTGPYSWKIAGRDITKDVVTTGGSGTRTWKKTSPKSGSLNAATDLFTQDGVLYGCVIVTDSKGQTARAFFETGFGAR